MILAAISCGKSKSDRDHPKIIPAVHGSLTDRRGEFRDTFLILAKKGPKVRFHPGIPGREGYTDGKNNSRRIVAAGRQCRSAARRERGKAYENTACTPKERAKDLLQELSLDEKIAQVRDMWDFPEEMANKNPEAKAAYEKAYAYGIGQVSTLLEREMTSTEDCTAFRRDLQKKIMEKSPHRIPAAFHMEGSCGSFVQDSANYPAGIGRGASFDSALERRIGEKVAAQELTVGITQVLAPVLDISRDSRMGRQGEPYGEDPTLCAAMGSAYTAGIQETKAAGRRADACARHFLGFHGANTDAGDRLIAEIYGKPFQADITLSNLRGVMPCCNCVAGEPASASRKLLKSLLREEVGNDGCVISDYGAVGNVHSVQKVGETAEEAAMKSLLAGMDCELPDGAVFGTKEFKDLIERAGEGSPKMQVLDRAVENILEAKFRMGLFGHPYDFNHEEPERFPFASREGGTFDLCQPDETSCTAFEEDLKRLQTSSCSTPYDHWGFARMKKEERLSCLRKAARRLAAFPNVWWSLANEYDRMDRFDRSWWKDFAACLHEEDPCGHLLSNHQCITEWDFADPNTTHVCLQSSAVMRTPLDQEKFKKPVLFDECAYEGNIPYNWDNITGQELCTDSGRPLSLEAMQPTGRRSSVMRRHFASSVRMQGKRTPRTPSSGGQRAEPFTERYRSGSHT